MQVRLTTEFSGTRDGSPWPKRGEIVELPDGEAVELLRAKHATAVVEDAEPETAAEPAAPETAAVNVSKK